VLVLTKDNFHDEVKKHPFLLVEFYAPWCGHCKAIKPEYAKAADALVGAQPKVTLAKIDTIVNEDIGKEFDIQGFPTLKWFVNGKAQENEMNERTADGIVKWCKKKSGNPAPVLDDKEKLSGIVDNSRFVAVGFFKGETKGAAYDAFKKAAMEDGRNEYYTVTDASLAKEHKVSKFPAIVFFRNFEEPRIDYSGKFESEAIREAAQAQSIRTVIEFTQENGEEIFANELVKVLLFGPDRTKQASDDFLKLAKEFKGKFVFASVAGGSDPELWSYIGASDEGKTPELFLFYPEEGFKYRLEQPFTYKEGKQFLQDYKEGKLKPFIKSEQVKEGWDKGLVKEVVGKQVMELVSKKDKHYVLMVYAPWCGHCKTFMPKYDKAAAHFDAKYGDEVVFAKMDGTANEIEGTQVQGFPTVLVYPRGSEDGPTDISQSTENLKEFAREIRTACDLSAVKREGEAEYQEAAKRFKAAVKKIKGSLYLSAEALNEAAAKVEAAASNESG
jgi:protein disulfide-isomerase A1